MILKWLIALKCAAITLLSRLDHFGTALKIVCTTLLGIV